MNNYVLDTDICIYWLNGKEKIQEKVKSVGTNKLSITIITYAELRYGAYNSQKIEKNMENINNFLTKLSILPLTKKAADKFGKLKAELRKNGTLIGDFDILIASVILCHNGILVSNNLDHFQRIKQLKCENWLG